MKSKTSAAAPPPAAAISPGFIYKKIGNTRYRVAVHFSGTSKERLEDKIMRLAKNELSDFAKNSLAYAEKCGILGLPQTGRLLEGGSLS